jgi:hypothetical protein
VCFHVLPAADLENVERNARQVLRAGHLGALLELDSPRDLEHALWSSAPEAESMRAWLASIGRIDAYLSFHTASCLSGGAFFYVQGDGPLAETLMATLRAETTSLGVPLLSHDPTPVPSRRREPGFFALQDPGQGALAYVHAHFAPQVSLISEIPVGVVSQQAEARAYQELSRRYVRGGVPARLLAPEHHVRCLVHAAMDLGRTLTRAETGRSPRKRKT